MTVENIRVIPAENGFTVNVAERGGKKSDYKERSMIAKDASEVAAMVEKACGKTGKHRGMTFHSAPTEAQSRSGNRKSSRRKRGSGKR